MSLELKLLLDFHKFSKKLQQNPIIPVNLFISHINNPPRNIHNIPSEEMECQNGVGNCDIFIGKPG